MTSVAAGAKGTIKQIFSFFQLLFCFAILKGKSEKAQTFFPIRDANSVELLMNCMGEIEIQLICNWPLLSARKYHSDWSQAKNNGSSEWNKKVKSGMCQTRALSRFSMSTFNYTSLTLNNKKEIEIVEQKKVKVALITPNNVKKIPYSPN